MTDFTQTGSFISLAGIVISVLAHFNILLTQDSAAAIVAGAIALYGVIHQIVAHKKAVTAGIIK